MAPLLLTTSFCSPLSCQIRLAKKPSGSAFARATSTSFVQTSLSDSAGAVDWDTPLRVPSLVARELLFAGGDPPHALRPPEPVPLPHARLDAATSRVAAAAVAEKRTLIPLLGQSPAVLAGAAAALVRTCGGEVLQPNVSMPRDQLAQALTAAWLRGGSAAAGNPAAPPRKAWSPTSKNFWLRACCNSALDIVVKLPHARWGGGSIFGWRGPNFGNSNEQLKSVEKEATNQLFVVIIIKFGAF